MEKVINIGLLGLGTVGGGVYKVLQNFKNVKIKKIAVKEIAIMQHIDGLDMSIVTENAMEVVNDPEIDIIVEVIGGVNPALNFIKTALTNGKHVVTANKELIAKHGEEVFELAKSKNVSVLYEAAVAGGIPIIMPIKTALCANKFERIAGILNGTTNYILTKMDKEGAEFATVLKEAQALGYAEYDPTGDVEGFDAAYKISILASLAFNKRIKQEQIYREGITNLSPVEFEYADEFGYKIKLIALAQETNCEIDVRVHPMLVSKEHPLAHINGVTNAVVIQAQPVNQIMFSGPGAGELPTASSVCGDILALAQEMQITDNPLPLMQCKHDSTADLMDISESMNKYFIRINVSNYVGVIGQIGTVFASNNISVSSIVQKGITEEKQATIVVLTEDAKEKDVKQAIEELKQLPYISKIFNVIRVMDLG